MTGSKIEAGKKLLFVVFSALALSGCASVVDIPDAIVPVHDQAGFWFGLWNGLTFEISFIGSLFNDEIAIYAVNNNGVWYDFGFILGVLGFVSSASAYARSD